MASISSMPTMLSKAQSSFQYLQDFLMIPWYALSNPSLQAAFANLKQNWSWFWKTSTALNQGLFVLLSVATNLSIAPLTPIYMAEWNKSLSQVALLVAKPRRPPIKEKYS
jgi:hypothetical protein